MAPLTAQFCWYHINAPGQVPSHIYIYIYHSLDLVYHRCGYFFIFFFLLISAVALMTVQIFYIIMWGIHETL